MRILLAFLLVLAVRAEDPDLAAPFVRRGLTGTMVVTALKSSQTFVHNQARARQPFIAASTFKIPNTLIGLEEKAVEGRESRFQWDGTKYAFEAHNADQTLQSAFQVSCFWCYQIIARRVGAEKYVSYLRRMNYGHLAPEFDVARFWLDGSLTISAYEQVEFLRALQQRKLPFGRHAFDTLAEIMIAETGPNYTLRAKTGWSGGESQVGWYVGYVETPDEVWFFATNIKVRNAGDLPERLSITREALAAKRILPGK